MAITFTIAGLILTVVGTFSGAIAVMRTRAELLPGRPHHLPLWL